MIGNNRKNNQDAEQNNVPGGFQENTTYKVVKDMNNVYKIVGLMAIIGLVILAMTSMAAAAETIGNVEAYTPGYEEQSNNMRYASRNVLEDDYRWSVEWEYNEIINGTIDTVKIRGRPAGGSMSLAYVLYINGENVGAPDTMESISSSSAGPGTTAYCWVWNDVSKDVDGKVLFEFAGASSGINAYVYVGRSGTATGTDVDNDGDRTVSLSLRNPNGKIGQSTKMATEWTGKTWEKVSSDVIYEFTYSDGTVDEGEGTDEDQEPTPVVENQEPNVPQLQSPANSAEDLDPESDIQLVAAVSDPDDDELSVFFYMDTQSMAVGNYETDSGIVTHTISAGTLDYGTTYEWDVSVYENTPDLFRADSDTYTFTTMDEPNIAPVAPTTVTENTIADGEELNIGDIFELGVPVEDEDGDSLLVTFYLKNGATRAIGDVTIDGSGDASITVDSDGLSYNETYEWWATVDDGNEVVETEHRTFSTAPEAYLEPETESDEGILLWVFAFILIVIFLFILYAFRGRAKALWYKAKEKMQRASSKSKTGKKQSTKKAGKAKAKPKKKAKPTMAKVRQIGTTIKTVTKTQLNKVGIFGKFVKDSFVLGYYAATSDVTMKNESHIKGKCYKCGKEDLFDEKEVFGNTRYYCKYCGAWQRDLEVTIETPKDKLLANKTKNASA